MRTEKDWDSEIFCESFTLKTMATKVKLIFADEFLTPQDEEILKRTFNIDDPAQISGLLERRPMTDEIPEIEYAYDTTPPGGRKKGNVPHLKCVFPHPARHWKGSIVRWCNGDRARLGPDCGEDHFGLDFKAARDRFTSARSRKDDLALAVSIRTKLPSVVEELRLIQRDPVVETYDELRRDLRLHFPDLYEALCSVALTGGILRTTRQERDFKGEEARAELLPEGRSLLKACEDAGAKGPGVVKACNKRLKRWMESLPPMMMTVSHEVGSLSGGTFLADPRPLAQTILSAAMAMDGLAKEFARNRSNHWNAGHSFSSTFNEIRDAISSVDAADQRLREGRRFSDNANLHIIANWSRLEHASQRPRIQAPVQAEGRTLIATETDARWTFPSALSLPALANFDELRRLLGVSAHNPQ